MIQTQRTSLRRIIVRMAGLFLVIPFLAGCDLVGSEKDFMEELVVESYQISGEPFQPIYLSRSAPVDQVYRFEERAVGDASVKVELLGAGYQVERTFSFSNSGETPGRYDAVEDHRVIPLRTYRLHITAPGFERDLTSVTVIPDTFRVVTANLDSVRYRGAEQFEVQVSLSSYPGRQNIYIIVSEALEPSRENLTPFAAGFLGDDYEESDLRNLASGSSPVVNEGNYDLNPDGTLSIKLPWLGVSFFGANRFTINALDDNLVAFIRSQTVQQGGSTFAPGEIPNVLDPIRGGTGIFAGYATAQTSTYVLRP